MKEKRRLGWLTQWQRNYMSKQPILRRHKKIKNKIFDDFLGELKTEKDPKRIKKLKRRQKREHYRIRASYKQALKDFELYMRWEDKERFRQLVESTELKDVFKGEEKYILGKGFAYSENIICPSCGQQFTYSFGSPGGKKGTKGVTFGVKEKGS